MRLIKRDFTDYLNGTECKSLLDAMQSNGYREFNERCRVYTFIYLFSLVAETLYSDEDGEPSKRAHQLALKVLLEEKVYFAPNTAEPFLSYLRTCHQMRFESAVVNSARKYALVPYKTTYSLIETARQAGYLDTPRMFND